MSREGPPLAVAPSPDVPDLPRCAVILLIVLGVLAFLGLLLVAAVEAIDRWASAEAPYQDTSRGTRRD